MNNNLLKGGDYKLMPSADDCQKECHIKILKNIHPCQLYNNFLDKLFQEYDLFLDNNTNDIIHYIS